MASLPPTTNDKQLPPEGSIRRSVYDCIVDLCAANRPATRKVVARELGLKFSSVDDHIKKLKDEGFIEMLQPGQFQPVDLVPDRVVSVTFVNNRVIVEVGDEKPLKLSMREGRLLAMGTAGISLLFAR